MTQNATKLEQYTALVRKYATTLDLTSPSLLADFDFALEKSEPFARALEQNLKILDIGSGVGLPGIPLAIARPDLEVMLCEIRQRRAAFLELAVSALGLGNVRVYNGDVRKLRQAEFDAVTAMAVGTLDHLYGLSQDVLKPDWLLVTRKGPGIEAEIAALRQKTNVLDVKLEPLEETAVLVTVRGSKQGGA